MFSNIIKSAIVGLVVFALAGIIVIFVSALPFVCAWSVVPGVIAAALVFLQGVGL